MNYLVTFSDHDCISEPKYSMYNDQMMLSSFALKFLQSYWGKDNVNELKSIVEQSRKSVNIEKLFNELNQYAARFFNTSPFLSLKYRENTITISQRKDTVYMNTMMSTVLWSYIATQIYHSYVMDTYGKDSAENLFCYQYTLFILKSIFLTL